MLKFHFKISIFIILLQIFLLVVLMNNLIMTQWGYYRQFSSESLDVFLSLLIFILSLLSIVAIRQLYKNSRYLQQYETEKLTFKHISEQNRLYREHKHDLKNHLAVISTLVKKNDLEELNSYLTYYSATLDENMIYVNTGIKELDALLYNKLNQARESDIIVEFTCNSKIKVHPRYIVDLIALMSNALDNAIDACDALESHEKRVLKVVLDCDPLDYYFYLANTCPQRFLENLFCDKEREIFQKPEKGQGLPIIRRIVKRFGGEAEWSTNEGLVELSLEIPRFRLEGSS